MRCAVSNQGYLFTDFDMEDQDITMLCRIYDDSITLDTIPDKYYLAFVYYVLHKIATEPGEGQYYYNLHSQEWKKIHRQQVRIPFVSYGGDI